MTKLRTPCTFADAMTRVAGVIGWPECERIAGRRSNRLVRAWSEEDSGKLPRIDIVRDLDVAYRAAGGEGSPFLEALAHQEDVTLSAEIADRLAITADCATAAIESGEALAATLKAAHPTAGPGAAHFALGQVREAETIFGVMRRRLEALLRLGTGPRPSNPGGTHQ
jgi:hypothetical protein